MKDEDKTIPSGTTTNYYFIVFSVSTVRLIDNKVVNPDRN